MSKKPKRIRSTNFTQEESLKLLELVKIKRQILDNRKTDAASWYEKKNAWEEIAYLYNANTVTLRSPEQLRQKFETLKKETRKYAAKQRLYPVKPGNILHEKVKQLISLSSDGLDNEFISDSLHGYPISVADNVEEIEFPETPFELHDNEVKLEPVVPFEEDVKEYDASSFSTSNTSDLMSRPKFSSVHIPTVSISPESSSASNTVALDIQESVTPPSVTERAPQRTERNANYKNKKKQLFFAERKLQSWVNARKDLVLLQQQLLKTEHAETLRREDTLYQKKLEIMELEKKKLLLEIKLKEIELAEKKTYLCPLEN